MVFSSLQGSIMLIISVGVFGLTVWALVDCLSRPAPLFNAAGKLSKSVWLVILGVATGVAFISLPPPLGTGTGVIGLLTVASVVAAGVYLADTRSKIRDMQERSRRRNQGGPTGWRT